MIGAPEASQPETPVVSATRLASRLRIGLPGQSVPDTFRWVDESGKLSGNRHRKASGHTVAAPLGHGWIGQTPVNGAARAGPHDRLAAYER